MMNFTFVPRVAFFICLISIGQNAIGKALSLDTVKVHQVYLEGDFEEGIEILEEFRQKSPKWTGSDSLFVFKHLGVMYSADSNTLEKGKFYLYRLLDVEPGAQILDMDASEMIQSIFNRVKEEHGTINPNDSLRIASKGASSHYSNSADKTQSNWDKGKKPLPILGAVVLGLGAAAIAMYLWLATGSQQ